MEPSRYLECLAADYGDLRDAVAAVEPTATVPTWFGPDQTEAFWIRRMLACESQERPEDFAEMEGGHLAAEDGQDAITLAATGPAPAT